MSTISKLGGVALTLILALPSSGALADAALYADFPVTLQGYDGEKDQFPLLLGSSGPARAARFAEMLAGGGGAENQAERKATMMAYYQDTDEGRAILAPRTKGPFVIDQSLVDQISKGKNLAGKTFKGTVTGMPNNMTGEELVAFWIDKAAAAERGVDDANATLSAAHFQVP